VFLAYHNARLKSVAGSGWSEDYDQPESGDDQVWTGDAEALVREEVLEESSGRDLDELTRTSIEIPANLAGKIGPGDKVTYLRDGQTLTREVQRVDDSSRLLGIIHLYLRDA
jgi:hypothetical protein